MKTLEEGQIKIKKICDQLKLETLEPAKLQAEKIIEEARKQSEQIIAEGEREAKRLIAQAHKNIEQERNVFHSSLQQSSKQAMEALRQDIEQKLFNEELQHQLDKQLGDPQILANLINAIVKDVEAKGIDSNIEVVISKQATPASINNLLLKEIQKKLEGKPLQLDSFTGGVQVKLVGKKMTIDLTDKTIKDLISKYIRKDFRQMLFNLKTAVQDGQ